MISAEDRELIEKLVECKNFNRRVSSSEVTTLYNRVCNKNVRPTGCSGCLRQRICEMERKLKAELEAAEETAEMTEENKEDKPKRGRPKKEKEE